MKTRMSICFGVLLFFCVSALHAQNISDYNVVWTTPSQHSGGSMPLGNGELGMNAWVEEGGDLLFYLSRTDAISEANRLMKLGRIRLHLSPNPFEKGESFRQTLLLNEGVIEIKAGKPAEEILLRLYMDSSCEVAYVTYEGKSKREVTVTAESWRRTPHIITKEESVSAWTTQPLPDGLKLEESADSYFGEKNVIGWYHANQGSQLYDLTMHHQDKEAYKENFPDPISGRVFGAYMTGKGLTKLNDSTFCSAGKVSKASLKIATHSEQASVDLWKRQIKNIDKKSSEKTALANSKKWWSDFWQRSYLYIDIPGDKDFAYGLTQSYLLQRYMSAGSGRGHFPIKFNGSIFTTDPKHTRATSDYGPDFRNWGNEFWWQNTRLPYYAMFASGDFDLMPPLFDFYLGRMDAFRTLASKYYDAKGITIPETVSVFGTFGNGDWGWDRTGVTSKDVKSMYLRYIWVQGLELSKILLDYYFYTGDTDFLVEKALPAIKEVLLYFDSRFVAGKERMRISPAQAVETYWFNVVNDMPCVAGLHYVMSALSTLPDNLVDAGDRAFFNRLAKTLPPLPKRRTVEGDIFLPAQEYLSTTSNVENPELYVVYPFGLSNLSNELKDAGIRTYNRRIFEQNRGWGQDGQVVAMLGMTELLPDMLRSKIANTNENHRFPTMWGPNYDWVPDQDHGSNLLITMHQMLLQYYDGKAYLLPAWPKEWNVTFKLYTPQQTVVQGEYKNGKLSFTQEGDVEVIPWNKND
ncbi:DUF5703 domain-containing protein [Parabacteroides sp. OttesenSCG-928-K15]|nr:DUF5703 domain-containing protein [Parabacteroides sp. OttesenSCG-928-K15]